MSCTFLLKCIDRGNDCEKHIQQYRNERNEGDEKKEKKNTPQQSGHKRKDETDVMDRPRLNNNTLLGELYLLGSSRDFPGIAWFCEMTADWTERCKG